MRLEHVVSDPYSILGISREATAEEIRRAYRHQAKLHHPDAGGDRRSFAQVLDAYEQLGGKISRRDAATRSTQTKQRETRPRPPPDSRPGANSGDSNRRVDRRGAPRRQRRYSAWRIVPDSYTAARFPRRSRPGKAPTRLEHVIAVAIWIGFLAVICLMMWILLRASFVERFPPVKPYSPPFKYLPPPELDLGPNTV